MSFVRVINSICRKILASIFDWIEHISHPYPWYTGLAFNILLRSSKVFRRRQLKALYQDPNSIKLLPNPVYFLHIPKTAGSSLKYWLSDLFGPERTLELYTLSSLAEQLPYQIRSYQYYTGHLGLSLSEFLSQDFKIDTFTWLRDPVKREISQYNYIRQTGAAQIQMRPGPELKNYINGVSQFSIAELCHSDVYQGYYDNLQTRMLGGLVPPQSYGESCPLKSLKNSFDSSKEQPEDSFGPSNLHQNQRLTMALSTLQICQQHHLKDEEFVERAKTKLLSLSHFGICEWMQASVDLFCYCFALPPQTFHYQLNSYSKKFGVTNIDELNTVYQCNLLDHDLYQFALKEFRNRIRTMWQDLCLNHTPFVKEYISNSSFWQSYYPSSEEVEVDILLNNWDKPELQNLINALLLENFQKRRTTDTRYQRFLFSFSEPAFWLGWHPRDYDSTSKTWFRWARPDTEASIFLPLAADQNYRIVFRVLHYANLDTLKSIRLFVSGTEIPLDSMVIDNDSVIEGFLFTGFVPASLVILSRPYTQFTFKTNQVIQLKFPERPEISPDNASFALSNFLAFSTG